MTTQNRETTTFSGIPREALPMTIDVNLLVKETAAGLVLISDTTLANLTIGPDYVDYKLTQPDLPVRFTFGTVDPDASVTTKATEVTPPDPNLLVDGPYVLPLNAVVDVTVKYTPAQQTKPKPKPKKISATLRVLPPGGGLS